MKPHNEKMVETKATIISAGLSELSNPSGEKDLMQLEELLITCLNTIENVVAYYDGKIVQFAGRSFLIVFNSRKSEQENTITALEAILEIQSKLTTLSEELHTAKPFQINAGISSGKVISGTLVSASKQPTLFGNTVDLAIKIRQIANPGQLLTEPHTYKLAKNLFDFNNLEPVPVKGMENPLPLFKLNKKKEPKPQPQSEHSRLIQSTMIGREKETTQLVSALVELSKGKGGIINIIGTPGTGKSRLVVELKKERIIEQLQWFEGRGLSHGQTFSYHPFTDIFKSWSGIKDEDNPAIAEKKLRSKIETVFPKAKDDIFPFIARFMGLSLSGAASERINEIEADALDKLMRKAIRDLLVSISTQQPMVIAIEDLHWADQSTLGLLKSLYELSRIYPILFINIMRPGYEHTSDPLVEHLNENHSEKTLTVEVSNLGHEHSSALISNLLQSGQLPKSICQTIVKKTNGNPFFIEEILRSFIDQGIIESSNNVFKINEEIESVNIPETINEVLLTRVENLDEKTRNLLDTASVIGRNFYFKVLDEAADTIGEVSERLQYLKSMQFIQESDDEENLEFVFKHALAHQAAYDLMVEKKRKALHLKIAESIEKVFPDRINEFYGTLAMHYNKAEYYKKAEDYLVLAGNEALKSAASSEAIDYFKEAFSTYLKNSGDAPNTERVVELQERIAFSYQLGGKNAEAIEYYDKVLRHYGHITPKSKIRRMVMLINNFLHLLIALNMPFLKFKKLASEHENKVLNIMYYKGKAIYTYDSKRWFFESLTMLRYNIQFDFSSTDYGRAIMAASSIFFNWAGISLSLAKKALDIGGKQLENATPTIQLEYYTYYRLNQFVAGDWKQDPSLEENYSSGIQRGEDFSLTVYLLFCGFINIELGLEKEAYEVIDKLKTAADEFDSEHTMAQYYRIKAVAAFKFRKMEVSFSDATQGIEYTSKTGHKAMLQIIYCMRSMSAAISDDMETASADFKEAKKLMPEQKRVKIWYSTYFLTEAYVLTEELRRSPEDKDLKKSLIKSCRSAIKQSAMVPGNLTESHRIMGNALWLCGNKKKAIKHYRLSIAAGEKVNGRLELSRSYFELGKRILSNDASQKVNGLSGQEYIEKARQLFTEMNLAYDLQELERFVNK